MLKLFFFLCRDLKSGLADCKIAHYQLDHSDSLVCKPTVSIAPFFASFQSVEKDLLQRFKIEFQQR
jgi:hypothetical protein